MSSENGFCPTCGSPVQVLSVEPLKVRAAGRLEGAHGQEAIEALRELVRLRDLKEADPRAYEDEDAAGVQAEAWCAAGELLDRLHARTGDPQAATVDLLRALAATNGTVQVDRDCADLHAKTTDALLLLAVARESMLVDDTHEQRIDAFQKRGLLQAVATGNPGQYEAHLTEAGWALLHDALEGAGGDG